MAGASIEAPTNDDIKDFQGIKIREGAKILLMPSFGVTLREIQNKFSGFCKITRQSVLILSGEETSIKDLDLDGTLITDGSQELIEGEVKNNKYVKYVNLDPKVDDMETTPEILKIRGYKLTTEDSIEGSNFIVV